MGPIEIPSFSSCVVLLGDSEGICDVDLLIRGYITHSNGFVNILVP